MIGTTFIAELDESRIRKIESVDDLYDFKCLELDSMLTLDFVMILGDSGISWEDGEPICLDGDGGMALCKVSAVALDYIIEHASGLNETQQSDLNRLAEFVQTHGKSNIFEFATF